MTVFAVEITTATAVSAIAVTIVGALTALYSARQSAVSGRRAITAEHERNLLAARTIDREDFTAALDGLRSIIGERTAQYNDLLATHKDVVAACRVERDEHMARIRHLETELARARRGGRPHDR